MIKEKIVEAYNYAKEKHGGQMRRFTNLPFFSHPKYVSRILELLTNDEELIIAALLHDVPEDTDGTIEEIRKIFGEGVANLVDGVTNKPEERGTLKKQVYQKMKMLKMENRVLTLKFADRLHNCLFLDRPTKSKEEKSFAIYYIKQTDFILTPFERELTPVNKALYDRLVGLISYLKYQYGI